MGANPSEATTKISSIQSLGNNGANLSAFENNNTRGEILLAQRNFRGFSGQYGSAPRRRSTAFRRGSCLPPQREITALLPSETPITEGTNQEVLGKDKSWYTAGAYPNMYIHVPPNSALMAELVVEDNNRNIFYSALIELPNQEVTSQNPRPQGFIGIDLSEQAEELGIPPMELGKSYLWEVQLICNNIDRSGNPLVTGWVTPIEESQQTRIDNLISQERETEIPWIYAENGIWYSALNGLAQNYLNQSDSNGWVTLLNSVGYNRIANDPIIGMAQVQKVFIGDLPEIRF
jgi:hypothetical protein